MAISTVGTIKQRHQTAVANNPAYDISATVQKDSYVLASSAADGFALVKDSAQGDGWGVGFVKLAGPTAPRTWTGPDADATLLTTNALVTVAQGGLGLATLTAHALYVGNGAGAPNAVAVGATGAYLRGVSASDPIWSTLILPNSATAGDLFVATGANAMGSLGIVAAGQVLVSGASPAWSASPTLTSVTLTGTSAHILRNDTGIEIQNPTNAGLSLLTTLAPGDTTGENFFVVGMYDAGSNLAKIGSLSWKWADATALTGYGVARLNATYKTGASTTADDVAIRVFGNHGVAIFGASDTVGPGAGILAVTGALTTSGTATVHALSVTTGNIVSPASSLAAAASYLGWNGLSLMSSPSDGNILLQNQNTNAFGLLQFGGTTAAFPALKRNSSFFDVRLADDSGFAAMRMYELIATNDIAGPGTTATAGDLRLQSGFTLQARNAGNTANAAILSTDAQDKTAIRAQAVTIASTAVYSLGSSATGYLFIYSATEDRTALYALGVSGHTSTEVSDPFSIFTNTAGSTNSINIYWSVGNARWEVENLRGSSEALTFTIIGTP